MLPLPVGREASAGVGASVYVRHRPERTLLYQLVREYYPAFKAQLAAQGTAGLRLARRHGWDGKWFWRAWIIRCRRLNGAGFRSGGRAYGPSSRVNDLLTVEEKGAFILPILQDSLQPAFE